jgi:hypothetical protein
MLLLSILKVIYWIKTKYEAQGKDIVELRLTTMELHVLPYLK